MTGHGRTALIAYAKESSPRPCRSLHRDPAALWPVSGEQLSQTPGPTPRSPPPSISHPLAPLNNMRTSRIARETNSVMRALRSTSSSRKIPPRHDVAQTRTVSAAALTAPEQQQTGPPIKPAHHHGHADNSDRARGRGSSPSDLSSVPSSDAEPTHPPPTMAAPSSSKPRKRKRSGTAPTSETALTAAASETALARPSPSSSPSKYSVAAEIHAQNGSINTTSAAKKARRAPAKKRIADDGSAKVEPPPNWEEMYSLTAEMRSRVVAPVDTMGCESLADRKDSPVDQRLQTLVALMLSSQTKDTVTAVAMRNLQDNLPGGFNLRALLQIEPAQLNSMIEKVGFHNNKTKFIKQTAEILRDKFDGDIPDTIEGLVSLPGVGPKMAYLCMSAAWGRDEGIGVDVHVHRITNLWGWHKTRTPEETRAALEAWLPKDKWHAINHLLVGFGQTICSPVGRKCGECTLAEKGLCPGAVVAKKQKAVKKEKTAVKVEVDGESIEKEVDREVKVEQNVKAEDVQHTNVMDIEDIGAPRTRRSSRRR